MKRVSNKKAKSKSDRGGLKLFICGGQFLQYTNFILSNKNVSKNVENDFQ